MEEVINKTKIKISTELTVEQITCIENGLIALQSLLTKNRDNGVPEDPNYSYEYALQVIKSTQKALSPIDNTVEDTLKSIRGW